MRTLMAGLLAFVATAAFSAALAPAHAGEECYPDWSEAGPIVRQQGLLPTNQIRVDGDLLSIVLCKENGRYVYRLKVLDADGQRIDTTIDAEGPAP